MRSIVLRICLSLAVLAAGLTSGANASLIIALNDPGTGGTFDVVVLDEILVPPGGTSPGGNWTATHSDGIPGVSGAVSFAGSFGSWTLTVTTALSKPLIGSTSSFELHLDSVSASSAGGGTLQIYAIDTGYVADATGVSQTEVLFGGAAAGTVQAWAWLDPTNTEFGGDAGFDPSPATLVATSPLEGPGAFAFATVGSAGSLTDGQLFSQAIGVEITHIDAGTTSFNVDMATSTEIPEPASLALWSVLIGGAALASARKRRGRWTKKEQEAILGVIANK